MAILTPAMLRAPRLSGLPVARAGLAVVALVAGVLLRVAEVDVAHGLGRVVPVPPLLAALAIATSLAARIDLHEGRLSLAVDKATQGSTVEADGVESAASVERAAGDVAAGAGTEVCCLNPESKVFKKKSNSKGTCTSTGIFDIFDTKSTHKMPMRCCQARPEKRAAIDTYGGKNAAEEEFSLSAKWCQTVITCVYQDAWKNTYLRIKERFVCKELEKVAKTTSIMDLSTDQILGIYKAADKATKLEYARDGPF